MRKINALILANGVCDDHLLWIKAINDYKEYFDYDTLDLSSSDWQVQIENKSIDICLTRPPGLNSRFKQLYDERLILLSSIRKFELYPSLEECMIYENKRFLSDWLYSNHFPFPSTNIFFKKNEALDYMKNSKFPVVSKMNIGASGSGVEIIRNKDEGYRIIRKVFSRKGVKRSWGPKWFKGNKLLRTLHYLSNPKEISQRIRIYNQVSEDIQKGFLMFQEFIPHNYEWRCVRIGDSFFAHKKIPVNGKASGTLRKEYCKPPEQLLNFIKDITDKTGFRSQCIDVFETNDGKYLINEMQCLFGQSDPYQMLVDGRPGRYIYFNDKWTFEEGDFARNACYHLRIEYIVSNYFNEYRK